MKFIRNILAASVLFVSATSCSDFLDVEPYIKDMIQYDSIFVRQSTTEAWLWNVYSSLKHTGAEIKWIDGGCFPFSSDEAIFSHTENLCEQYQNAQYSAYNQLKEDRYQHLYVGVRTASIFIQNVHKCLEVSSLERSRMEGEARFLRAYFYFMLMKQYGPVPIVPEEGQDVSLPYDQLALPRASFDDCVEYVVGDLEKAAIVLPERYSSLWVGRATQGAALALRAKMLLYAASPLFNGNTDLFNLKDDEGNALINQTVDNRKWGRAAAAAKELIELGYYTLNTVKRSETTAALPDGMPDLNFPNGAKDIDPYESYRQTFTGDITSVRDTEIIFFRQNYGSDLDWLVGYAFPVSHNGKNAIGVTLKQVESYYMRDGKDRNDPTGQYEYYTSGFTTVDDKDDFVPTDVHKMFLNREPRFYASVSYNNCIWENLSGPLDKQNFRVNYYRAGADGKQLSRPYEYPLTGIGLKKYYAVDDSWDTNGKRNHKVEPAIRYADVLLWYAEALNELTDEYTFERVVTQGDITVKREVKEMREAFSQVRYRAGVLDLTDAEYADYETFKSKLKRERQIELFLESARYFDLRRWKDAMEEENEPILGFNVDMKASGTQKERFYQATPVSMSKVFMSKMYLWPISTEQLKRNPRLTQNPGW